MATDSFRMFWSKGIPVRIHPVLPQDDFVFASDIETREEVKLLTGKQIHAFIMTGILYVSKELYGKLEKDFWKEKITIN